MKHTSEAAFEAHIVEHLTGHAGYEEGRPEDYDRENALLTEDFIGFIKDTQPKQWSKLEQIHNDNLTERLVAEFVKVASKNPKGVLAIIRRGFSFYGEEIKLAAFAPAHGRNPEIERLYSLNRLKVVRQVKYDPKNENSLDLVFFLNGIPVVTVELKNQMTGQTAAINAINQYKFDRDPKAPIFRFKERAIVHFAVDTDEAWMTTRLSRSQTRFLPFNQGDGTGKGNPRIEGRHRTCYLWEQVWKRDSLLDLIHRFIHLEVVTRTDSRGRKTKHETMIFPRYHQLGAVRKIVAAAKVHGAGKNYLVQHSAGSGKSNTIAWLAHRLHSLHDDNDKKVYDAVIVLTDRLVLDQQLQDTIYQFDHKQGVVQKIDQSSQQLADALTHGKAIIISTIHKFGFISKKVGNLPDRTYALIVDEAHSSQSGEMSTNVREILADSSIQEKVDQAATEADLTPEDQRALLSALHRGQQKNLSFFAFTATPKYKTLELFGHRDSDGKPIPFHLYSMRQAIEEDFILDVLKGYITYKRFIKLVKSVEDDPEFDKRKAARALSKFINLHPSNIAQKTEIIIEHFRTNVRHKIGGRAKAMVVTGSRLSAVKYKLAFDAYLREKNYADVKCLVAFSGDVFDSDFPGQIHTEVSLNAGIKEAELPDKFSSDEYQLLLVAQKYQTGFDQPLLAAMYVDKRLSGIQAVQTLSRLNRKAVGKDSTFVLDFVNEREGILESFQDFYEGAEISESVDPQRLYEFKTKLDDAQIYTPSEVDGFAAAFFKLKPNQSPSDHAKLNSWLDPAVDRFNGKESEEQDEIRKDLLTFKNLYVFLSQVMPFTDIKLEKLHAYGRMLIRKLPRSAASGPIDLGDDVALHSLVLKKASEGTLDLEPGEGRKLSGPAETGTGRIEDAKEHLSTIIEEINTRFGTEFDAQDLVDGVTEQLAADEKIITAANANDRDGFSYVFNPALDDALVDRHGKHGEFIDKIFGDKHVGKFFRGLMLDAVYERLTPRIAPSESITK